MGTIFSCIIPNDITDEKCNIIVRFKTTFLRGNTGADWKKRLFHEICSTEQTSCLDKLVYGHFYLHTPSLSVLQYVNIFGSCIFNYSFVDRDVSPSCPLPFNNGLRGFLMLPGTPSEVTLLVALSTHICVNPPTALTCSSPS